MEWEDNDNEPEEPAVDYSRFPDSGELRYWSSEMQRIVRSRLSQPSVSVAMIRQLAAFLFALERLPKTTPGIDLCLTVNYRFGAELSYHDVYLSDSELRLTTGGSVYDPGVGSDSYSTLVLDMNPTGYVEGHIASPAIIDWLGGFEELLNLGGRFDIDYFGDDAAVDWEASTEDAEDLDETESENEEEESDSTNNE